MKLGFQGLGSVFGAGNSFKALLWASMAGCIVALVTPLFYSMQSKIVYSHGVESKVLIKLLSWII